jgi:hypothetical protein
MPSSALEVSNAVAGNSYFDRQGFKPATSLDGAPGPNPVRPEIPSHSHGPNAISDLMMHFESVKQRCTYQVMRLMPILSIVHHHYMSAANERLTDVNALHAALENGISSAPEPRDSER